MRCLTFRSCQSARTLPVKQHSSHRMKVTASLQAEQLRYIEEIAVVPQPQGLRRLTKVLELQQHQSLSPADRSGLHPLVIPLSVGAVQTLTGYAPVPKLNGSVPVNGSSPSEVYVCLLRWPNARQHKSMAMPVVAMEKNGRRLTLLARSAEEYVNRALVEEDTQGGPGALSSAVAAIAGDGEQPYQAGQAQEAQLPSLAAFLTRKVGFYTDVVEQLVTDHLAKGDTMSAMITGEWYMRDSHFSGWARPFEFNSLLFSNAGRHEEARDVARIALRMPWWSLSLGFPVVRDMAGLQGSVEDVAAAMAETQSSQHKQQFVQYQDPQQEALDAADLLMNRAAAGEATWDDIRKDLAAKYVEAGNKEVADFILAA